MIDGLYTIEMLHADGFGSDFVVSLNPSNVIYSAHFPSVPVTPGACLVEIVRKAACLSVGRDLKVSCMKNVKFLKTVDPRVTCRLLLHCDISEIPVDQGFNLTATVSDEDALFVKAQLVLE